MSSPPDSTELLLERAHVDYTLRVHGDADRIHAFLSLEPHRVDARVEPEDVLAALREAGLVVLPDLPDRLRAALEQGPAVRALEAARGVPPQKGEPARPDWKIQIEPRTETKVLGQEDDRVDFYTYADIIAIPAGQVLFETIPPTRGPAGTDVYGREIPGLLGDPLALGIGENVEYDPDSGVGKAKITGQVVLERGAVRVDPVYRVEGDVDFKTGNIDFEGSVVVGGNVQDGFTVKAGKDITVHGSVFAATLGAGGDIRIHEGATMRGKGELRAGGKLQAKYLNHAIAKAQGDVLVSSEIINSEVRAGGRLLIPRGNIFGGKVVAMGGIEARQLGSPMVVPTQVCVGVDPDVQKRLEAIDKEIKELEKKMERILMVIRPLMEDPQRVLGLPPAQRERATAQLREIMQMKAQVEALRSERAGLGAGQAPRDPRVKVLRRIYSKVTVTISRCTQTYTQETPGPLDLGADESKGRIVGR